MIYSFTLTLADDQNVVLSEEMTNQIFDAGCDDCLVSCSDGVCTLGFDRESETLHAALISAITQIEGCGLHVMKVTADDDLALAPFLPSHLSEIEAINLMLQLRQKVTSSDELVSLWRELAHSA